MGWTQQCCMAIPPRRSLERLPRTWPCCRWWVTGGPARWRRSPGAVACRPAEPRPQWRRAALSSAPRRPRAAASCWAGRRGCGTLPNRCALQGVTLAGRVSPCLIIEVLLPCCLFEHAAWHSLPGTHLSGTAGAAGCTRPPAAVTHRSAAAAAEDGAGMAGWRRGGEAGRRRRRLVCAGLPATCAAQVQAISPRHLPAHSPA